MAVDDVVTAPSRDPFQLELFEAVRKHRKRTGGEPEELDKSFDGKLNEKMSKYVAKPSATANKDNKFIGEKDRALRDEFLRAFVDHDVSRDYIAQEQTINGREKRLIEQPNRNDIVSEETKKNSSHFQSFKQTNNKSPTTTPAVESGKLKSQAQQQRVDDVVTDDIIREKKKRSRHYTQRNNDKNTSTNKTSSRVDSDNMTSSDVLDKFNSYLREQNMRDDEVPKVSIQGKSPLVGKSSTASFNLKNYESESTIGKSSFIESLSNKPFKKIDGEITDKENQRYPEKYNESVDKIKPDNRVKKTPTRESRIDKTPIRESITQSNRAEMREPANVDSKHSLRTYRDTHTAERVSPKQNFVDESLDNSFRNSKSLHLSSVTLDNSLSPRPNPQITKHSKSNNRVDEFHHKPNPEQFIATSSPKPNLEHSTNKYQKDPLLSPKPKPTPVPRNANKKQETPRSPRRKEREELLNSVPDEKIGRSQDRYASGKKFQPESFTDERTHDRGPYDNQDRYATSKKLQPESFTTERGHDRVPYENQDRYASGKKFQPESFTTERAHDRGPYENQDRYATSKKLQPESFTTERAHDRGPYENQDRYASGKKFQPESFTDERTHDRVPYENQERYASGKKFQPESFTTERTHDRGPYDNQDRYATSKKLQPESFTDERTHDRGPYDNQDRYATGKKFQLESFTDERTHDRGPYESSIKGKNKVDPSSFQPFQSEKDDSSKNNRHDTPEKRREKKETFSSKVDDEIDNIFSSHANRNHSPEPLSEHSRKKRQPNPRQNHNDSRTAMSRDSRRHYDEKSDDDDNDDGINNNSLHESSLKNSRPQSNKKKMEYSREENLSRNDVDEKTLKTSAREQRNRKMSAKLDQDKVDNSRTDNRRETKKQRAYETERLTPKKSSIAKSSHDRSSRKEPLKATVPLEKAVKSSGLLNDNNSSQKKKGVDHRQLSSKSKRKSASLTNISNIQGTLQDINFGSEENLNATSLRTHIYNEWLARKNSKILAEQKIKEEEKKRKKEEKFANVNERKEIAQKTYNAWVENKSEKIKTRKNEERKRTISEKEKEDEKEQKKKDAKKFFDSWKQTKDEKLKEEQRKKKREIQEKKRKEMEEKEERITDAKKTFDMWKTKKEEYLKEKLAKEKLNRKEKEYEEIEKEERKQASQRVFEAWKSGKQSRPSSARSASPMLTQRAWCPSSRNSKATVIPPSVQPVILRKPPSVRKRTMSASGKLQNTKHLS